MGLFDGLIAKVEGAVTSAEATAAGLFNSGPSTPLSPPRVVIPNEWQGPLQPGQAPFAPVSVTPKAGPVAVPVSSGTFDMVADALNKVPGVPALESFFGFSSPTPAPAADYSSESQAWTRELVRWCNVLKSMDSTMNAKDGAADLSAAYRSWESGPYNDALSKVAALQNGHADEATVKAAYQSAVAQAQAIQKAIQDRWAQFAAQGAPTVADYVKAPFTAARETGMTVYSAASRAEAAVERAAAQTGGDLATFAKYAPWALGGVAVLYVLSVLPRGRGAN